MSVLISALVWETDLPPSEKIILLAYADFAGHDGTRIFPSLEQIARMTGYGKRSVRRLTRCLEAKGYLVPISDQRGGRGRTNRWVIPLKDGSLSPAASTPARIHSVSPPPAKAYKTLTNTGKGSPIDTSKRRTSSTEKEDKSDLKADKRVTNPDKPTPIDTSKRRTSVTEKADKADINPDKNDIKADIAVSAESSVNRQFAKHAKQKQSGNRQSRASARDPPKSTRKRSKPSGKGKRKRDPRLDHPAIKAYRAEAHLHVPITWRDEVIAVVEDAERWRLLVQLVRSTNQTADRARFLEAYETYVQKALIRARTHPQIKARAAQLTDQRPLLVLNWPKTKEG